MTVFLIDLKVDVVPKERSRATGHGYQYTPEATKNCMELLAYRYRQFMADKDPIPKKIDIKISFKLWVSRKQYVGDLDNYYKTFTDAGNKILYSDDKYITSWGRGDLFHSSKKPRLLLKLQTVGEQLPLGG